MTDIKHWRHRTPCTTDGPEAGQFRKISSDLDPAHARIRRRSGGALHGGSVDERDHQPCAGGASRAPTGCATCSRVGDTIETRARSRPRKERDRLRTHVDQGGARRWERALRRWSSSTAARGLKNTNERAACLPVARSGTRRSASTGSDDGAQGPPVINEEGSRARHRSRRGGPGHADDGHDIEGVGAGRQPARRSASRASSAGNPTDLVVRFTPAGGNERRDPRRHARHGVRERSFQSLYPPGLPIGTVMRIDNEGTDTQEIHVKPYADIRSRDFVQILTRPEGPDG